jgi:aminoglycoside 2''-phosphotransferase
MNFSYSPTLRHGDFGISSLLFDLGRGELTGVIDFSGAALGNPAVDFAGLLISYGGDFLLRIQRSYPITTEMMARARFYIGTFALEEALFGYENGDGKALATGFEEYI